MAMTIKKDSISLSAVVLAGGQSSRMGRDKALILIEGIPLIQRVCEVAQLCAAQVYVVTSWPDRYQDILRGRCQLIREVPCPETGKPQGPLVGFAQALAYVQTDWVLLLACDLPKLKVEGLQEWTAELGNVSAEAVAFLPRHSKGWEPLCGFYRRSCLPQLREFINQGGRSFQKWLAQCVVQELPLIERQLLFNCNTPADLEEISEVSSTRQD